MIVPELSVLIVNYNGGTISRPTCEEGPHPRRVSVATAGGSSLDLSDPARARRAAAGVLSRMPALARPHRVTCPPRPTPEEQARMDGEELEDTRPVVPGGR